MLAFEKRSQAALYSLGAMLFFTTAGLAQIPGLCNTGEGPKTFGGCTGGLVTPTPPGSGPNRDGNWLMAYPYPVTLSESQDPCPLKFIRVG